MGRCGYRYTPYSVLCLLKVGLTVLGRPRSAFGNGVRHIIAARDEARPHALAADQQGRWSLPAHFQIHSRAEGRVAATALPSTWPAFLQKTYW